MIGYYISCLFFLSLPGV